MKGVLKDVLPTLIIVVGLLVVLLIIYLRAIHSTDREIDETKCRASIITSAVAASTLKDLVSVTLACPPILRELPDDEPEIYQTIARDIDRCHERWFKPDGTTYPLFENNGVYCVPCAIYTFETEGKQYSGLLKTLARYPSPQNPVLDKLVALKGNDRTALYERIQQGELAVESLNTSNAYVIMYAQAHGDLFIQSLLSGHRTETGAAGGVLVMTGVGMTGGATALAFIAGTGPVGWIAGGLVLIGLGAATIYNAFEPVLSPDPQQNPAVLVLRTYDATAIQDMGCTVAPQPNDYRKGAQASDWAKP